jgi:hypothetical protein
MSFSTDYADRGTEFSGDEFDEAYPPGYELHYWHRARGGIVRELVRSFARRVIRFLRLVRDEVTTFACCERTDSTLTGAISVILECMTRCTPSFSVKQILRTWTPICANG